MITAVFSIKRIFTRRNLFLIFFVFIFSKSLYSQPPFFRTYNYIETYSVEAVNQMIQYKIPASVILAQAILESRSGTSELAKRANNHFGIKCHVGWAGDTILKDDDSTSECFRSYRSIQESYDDHSRFLASRPRYAHLFSLPVNDYKSWCYGLKNAGYATAPKYAEELIKIIEEIKLYEFDRVDKLLPRSSQLASLPDVEIRHSKYDSSILPLYSFVKTQLLFWDETDVVVQSLRLLNGPPERNVQLSMK